MERRNGRLLLAGILTAATVGAAAFVTERNGLSLEPVPVFNFSKNPIPRLGIYRTEAIGVCPDGSAQMQKHAIVVFPDPEVIKQQGDILVFGQKDNCMELSSSQEAV